MKIKLLLLKYDKDCNITLAQNSSIYIILFHIYKCINAYMYVHIYIYTYTYLSVLSKYFTRSSIQFDTMGYAKLN